MFFYALLAAFISYVLNTVYNLLNGQALKTVFYSGIRYFVLAFLITGAVQLIIYLYRDLSDNSFLRENNQNENNTEEIQESEKEAENEA
jgi:predicted PurR-regulated permease PerM